MCLSCVLLPSKAGHRAGACQMHIGMAVPMPSGAGWPQLGASRSRCAGNAGRTRHDFGIRSRGAAGCCCPGGASSSPFARRHSPLKGAH